MEARTFGSYSGKNETLFLSDVRLGEAAVPHDIIERFPWYPLIGRPRVTVGTKEEKWVDVHVHVGRLTAK